MAQQQDTFPHFATLAIHSGYNPDQVETKAVVMPITLTTTYKQKAAGEPFEYEYSRGGNPNRDAFEKTVAALEGGTHAIAASSGLAAQSIIANLLKSGDHVICMNDVYGGTHRYFRLISANSNIETSFVDVTDSTSVEKAIKDNTKIVWMETPTNPLLRLVDIKKVVETTRRLSKGAIVVVDNTFMTPYFQRPLELGADVVLHSVTKYLNGHSDVTMGIVVTKDDELAKKMRFIQFAGGPVPSAFDCYLAGRGIKTLHIRMREHQRNAMAVAKFLEASPHVTEVMYPGLPSHPQYKLAKTQCKGFSGVVSFKIKGNIDNLQKFASSIKVFTLAESLGGYESLVDHPYTMTHASIPEKERVEAGVTETLIRLSVGLEDTQDLLDDLKQALEASQHL